MTKPRLIQGLAVLSALFCWLPHVATGATPARGATIPTVVIPWMLMATSRPTPCPPSRSPCSGTTPPANVPRTTGRPGSTKGGGGPGSGGSSGSSASFLTPTVRLVFSGVALGLAALVFLLVIRHCRRMSAKNRKRRLAAQQEKVKLGKTMTAVSYVPSSHRNRSGRGQMEPNVQETRLAVGAAGGAAVESCNWDDISNNSVFSPGPSVHDHFRVTDRPAEEDWKTSSSECDSHLGSFSYAGELEEQAAYVQFAARNQQLGWEATDEVYNNNASGGSASRAPSRCFVQDRDPALVRPAVASETSVLANSISYVDFEQGKRQPIQQSTSEDTHPVERTATLSPSPDQPAVAAGSTVSNLRDGYDDVTGMERGTGMERYDAVPGMGHGDGMETYDDVAGVQHGHEMDTYDDVTGLGRHEVIETYDDVAGLDLGEVIETYDDVAGLDQGEVIGTYDDVAGLDQGEGMETYDEVDSSVEPGGVATRTAVPGFHKPAVAARFSNAVSRDSRKAKSMHRLVASASQVNVSGARRVMAPTSSLDFVDSEEEEDDEDDEDGFQELAASRSTSNARIASAISYTSVQREQGAISRASPSAYGTALVELHEDDGGERSVGEQAAGELHGALSYTSVSGQRVDGRGTLSREISYPSGDDMLYEETPGFRDSRNAKSMRRLVASASQVKVSGARRVIAPATSLDFVDSEDEEDDEDGFQELAASRSTSNARVHSAISYTSVQREQGAISRASPSISGTALADLNEDDGGYTPVCPISSTQNYGVIRQATIRRAGRDMVSSVAYSGTVQYEEKQPASAVYDMAESSDI